MGGGGVVEGSGDGVGGDVDDGGSVGGDESVSGANGGRGGDLVIMVAALPGVM